MIPLLTVSILAYIQSQNALREKTIEQLDEAAKNNSANITDWLESRKKDLKVMSSNARIQSMDPAAAKSAIDQFYSGWGRYETIAVVDTTGLSIATNNDTQMDLSDRAYVKDALKGNIVISQPVISKATGNLITAIAAQVIVESKTVGVVLATVPTTYIANLMSNAQLGKTGEAYLVNSDSYMITPSRFEEELKKSGLIKTRSELELKIDTFATQQALAGFDGLSEYKDYRGNEVIGAYHWIPEHQWAVIVEQDTKEAFAAVTNLRNAIIFLITISLIAIVIISLLVARSISKPIQSMSETALLMSQGKINQNITYHSNDEIGTLANSFREMINFQISMANSAEQLSNGDLTAEIRPKSEEDVLGVAFERMIKNLRDAIGEVASNAANLNQSSAQLAQASDQAGQATSQIATTIQQVARGTSQQTEAATHSAASVEQLRRAIENVSRGAQAQAEAVSKMAALTGSLSSSIQQVAGNANAVSVESNNAATAAREGSTTVADTIEGMETIREKVGFSAKKVQEMGNRSDQIGAIVETIDDIASQTNLLALNAAIEAARAGEHGKGFAVVADEVRKLAERSSAATKEIGSLIRGIQETVAEAVTAMNESAAEVETGTERASKAGTALENILKAAEAVNEQAQLAASAVSQMGSLSNELVAAADDVSAIVEENTAATEEMAAGSNEITQAIDNIASVSEENSAAVEEVSASAEEMSAQVEEVTASAMSLSEMADLLQKTVDRFKLN
ncbi:MAG: HAMP domain-containing protein [Chloroflexi bacterium]|nr:HAMP domain-containing protein [Chloroflexota bacterium]